MNVNVTSKRGRQRPLTAAAQNAALDDLDGTLIIVSEGRDDDNDEYDRRESGKALTQMTDSSASSPQPELLRFMIKTHIHLMRNDWPSDAEALHTAVNRAYWGHELPGIPTGRGDRLRRYTLDDVNAVLLDPAFAERREAERARRAQLAAENRAREQALSEADVQAEIAAERKLCPHLWAALDELKYEFALMRGEQPRRW